MSDRIIGRRDLLKLGAATSAFAMIAACFPQQQTPGQSAAPTGAVATDAPATAGKFPLGKLEGAEVILDPTKFPKVFKEAPELAALVQQGKLPPVAQRIGQDPLVIKPVHAIGKYGGTLRKATLGAGAGNEATAFRFAAGPDSLLYWDWEWKKVIPNIARSFDQSSDGKTLTIQLRRGMKWSDGAPFTADDVMFWYEDMYRNRQLVSTPLLDLQINGKDVVIEKIDQNTIRFVSPEPNHLLPEKLVSGDGINGPASGGYRGWGLYAPKHYLSKFHPKYTPQAEIDRLMAEGKFTSWPVFFSSKNAWVLNSDLPVLAPWRTTRPANDPNAFVMERNPYSVWVDTEGNQLPYIGTLHHALAQDVEVVALRAVAGEVDFQDRHLAVNKLPVLLEGQQRGGYKLHIDPQTSGLGIMLNLAYDEDPEIGELLRNVDFRRALSMGIDRDQINEIYFLGTGTPGSAVPSEQNRYFPGKEWRTKWHTLDVAQSNQLLDKIGLTQKDSEGYRLRKDGKGRVRLEFLALNRLADFSQLAETLKAHWQKIGIDLLVQTTTVTLAIERIRANKAQMTGNTTGTEDVYLSFVFIRPSQAGFAQIMGGPFAAWEATGGKQGKEPFPAMKQFMELWNRGVNAAEKERIEIGKEITRMHVDQVFTIALVGQDLSSYGLRYAKTGIGNMPARIHNGNTLSTTINAHPMTFYWK